MAEPSPVTVVCVGMAGLSSHLIDLKNCDSNNPCVNIRLWENDVHAED